MTAPTRVLTTQERVECVNWYNIVRSGYERGSVVIEGYHNMVFPAVVSLVKTVAVGAFAAVAVLFMFKFNTLATSVFIVSATVVGLLSLGVRLAYGYVRIARAAARVPGIPLPR